MRDCLPDCLANFYCDKVISFDEFIQLDAISAWGSIALPSSSQLFHNDSCKIVVITQSLEPVQQALCV